MYDRRKFLKLTAVTASLTAISKYVPAKPVFEAAGKNFPIVISTWDFGIAANKEAWKTLAKGGRALDAVEAGVKIPEADMKNHTVGRAGYPTATDTLPLMPALWMSLVTAARLPRWRT
jgi:N4-(beta-N-acetylglucosaminyl)-L-asparaginase